MVLPNAPRFLREGDKITIQTKIANLTKEEQLGTAVLRLVNGLSLEAIDIPLGNGDNERNFTIDAGGNTEVSWNLSIPEGIQSVQYTVIAKSQAFSDGEQNWLPVLPNRMLVTETLPMWVRSNETRSFSLDKLKNNTSPTLRHERLTLEITSNPAWYAVQALPYLMEYPYECSEQTFARYYANALATHIVEQQPRIKQVFDQWKDSETLLSNLEKNEELKSLLIQETPWLREAQSEGEQKKRIALLFDYNKMNNELIATMNKLRNNQMTSGAWPWFRGGLENRYITQHIATGFGHLEKLGVSFYNGEKNMLKKAVTWLDEKFLEEYDRLKRYNPKVDLTRDHLSNMQLQYLYMRSFYPYIEKSERVQEVTDYYLNQIKTYWLDQPLYARAMMAIITYRQNEDETATAILTSLKETSIVSEELGMYWKSNTASWYWYRAPIETQALLIEAFSDITRDTEAIDNMKIWLLKHKRTNRWETTRSTTDAIYAILLQGSDWLSVTEAVDVSVGGSAVNPNTLDNVQAEAGTGYFKTSWGRGEISPEMADVTLSKKGDGVAWGGLYWQYFEDLDNITKAESPLKVAKKLFLVSNADRGEEMAEITDGKNVKVGDLIRVRIEIRTDRDMEFIHMKDMRAAGLEPVDIISEYKWQDGLGYYQATKDASTNFFFDWLPKGVYVFEYDLRVNNSGDFGNGITTLQSMYAPEFSSHSEGVRLKVN